jgi:predicted metal-dependent phosphoesterase TrpH
MVSEKIDLHTHSEVSDGTDSPSELVARATQAGLDVVALTDHDTFAGLDEAVAAGQRAGIRVIRGVELSCSSSGDSVHLLAYGVDEADPELTEELEKVRAGRSGRVSGVLERLSQLGVPVTEDEVLAQVGDSPSTGRPHIADALVARGHVHDRQEAFDRFLADGGPAHIPRYTIDIDRGIDLVHAAGGIAVIAHPWGRGREASMPAEKIESLVAEHGLEGIEVDHQDHDAQTRARLRDLGTRLAVLMTGSSDYHGAGKVDHDLGVNTTDPAMLARLDRLMTASRPSH